MIKIGQEALGVEIITSLEGAGNGGSDSQKVYPRPSAALLVTCKGQDCSCIQKYVLDLVLCKGLFNGISTAQVFIKCAAIDRISIHPKV